MTTNALTERNEQTPPPEFMTPAEVAGILRATPKTIARWAREGKLNSIRTPGGVRRYPRSEVQALLATIYGSTPVSCDDLRDGDTILVDGRTVVVTRIDSPVIYRDARNREVTGIGVWYEGDTASGVLRCGHGELVRRAVDRLEEDGATAAVG